MSVDIFYLRFPAFMFCLAALWTQGLRSDNRSLGPAMIQNATPAPAKGFSITISRNGQDVLTLSGGGTMYAVSDKSRIFMVLNAGNAIRFDIHGGASGDYKFQDATNKEGKSQKGSVVLMLYPTSAAAKKEFNSGLVISIGGTMHLTVGNGMCSGHFTATIAPMQNGNISDIKYEAKGSFNDIPLMIK